MYFCSGPPRIYAVSDATEGMDDVALAMHPSKRVFARVTSSVVTLWSASLGLSGTTRRLVARCDRDGQEHRPDKARAPRQVWAAWVIGDRLAVVEKHARVVELYAFPGLDKVVAHAEPWPHPMINDVAADDDVEATADTTDGSRWQCAATLVVRCSLNEGMAPKEDQQDDDVATSMAAVPGGTCVFIGMASGMISVVEVADTRPVPSRSAPAWTKSWTIDVRKHVRGSKEDDETPPRGCDDLAVASSDVAAATAPSLSLLATFEGTTCFLLVLSPVHKRIDLLLSLVTAETEATSSHKSRCTTTSFDTRGSKLALGWSDGRVSVFRVTQRNTTAQRADPERPTLTLAPIQALSLVSWGYPPGSVGAVTALAWSYDAQSLAVGYAVRGFSVFSLDGCRLMSSLPQQSQARPAPSHDDAYELTEVCAYGVLGLAWTSGSHSLLVVPQSEELMEQQRRQEDEEECVPVTALYETIHVQLRKGADGLCLSLSGAPGRCGAWVRSDKCFTARASDGGMGPAEASGQIQGGDLIVGINDHVEVVHKPFEEIVRELKQLPEHHDVVLTFVRLKWDKVFPLAVEALASTEFRTTHGLRLVEDDDLCVREYALRMQALYGDCEAKQRPSLMDGASRAKVHAWEALRGTSSDVATHRYVKLLFALFPVWNPLDFLRVLTEHHRALVAQHTSTRNEMVRNDVDRVQRIETRKRPSIAFAEFAFAKRVPWASGRARLALLESQSLRLVAAPSLDDPCAVTSCVTWTVPSAFEKCCPLRLVACSASGKHVAVAGQRGFCLLHAGTGKWRMFGNVNHEQDMLVYALVWVGEDTIVVMFTRFSEQHERFHFQAYPRNHLDDQSMLHELVVARERADTTPQAVALDDCHAMLECDRAYKTVFCIQKTELWCFQVQHGGSIHEHTTLWMEMQLKQRIKLPSRVLPSLSCGPSPSHSIVDFAVLPRFLHLQDDRVRTNQQHENEQEPEPDGWLASFVHRLAGGQVPDQYTPEEVLPRFVFVDHVGDVIVWDPENRSQRLICSNVSTMTILSISAQACASWPDPCRLIYGLYGPDGMRLWLPLLDGVYLTHTQAFQDDPRALRTFLACHDPLRAKTYDIEFGTAPATAELYDQVVREYGGILLEGFLATGTGSHPGRMKGSGRVREGYSNRRGCVTTVDDPSATDRMLCFDYDVTVLGIEPALGLLVGVSQDVYVPSGVLLPCYDVFTRVQPIFHTLLCFLVENEQLAWARRVLECIRQDFALSSSTQELFLHSMLEACFAKRCDEDTLDATIDLLRYATDATHEAAVERAEYCEIVAHVARKSEPSRLSVLFPRAGDPIELLARCLHRSELQTSANFLLLLEDSSPLASACLPRRLDTASELLNACIEQDEWGLAQHVVRVAREWDVSTPNTCARGRMEAKLASLTWENLVRGDYERVVACVNELDAKLPPQSLEERHVYEEEARIVDRLHRIFIQGNKRKELRYGWNRSVWDGNRACTDLLLLCLVPCVCCF
ncbi:hypothetical protein PsorP6_017297 [Peronosclerospora sorghi]|uniref:Uncharacterized protein n=1 Tax=Peronosclerospora sorghi TaxID=230839 RepID=A0ACC0WL10_9STRA|nr:hypothetical protein PsorP6_017297 [Peronosclerospora sorghi]